MSKQDRQGVRTPAGLDQKYNLGAAFKNQAAANEKMTSEMNLQNMTMRQFVSYVAAAITKIEVTLRSMKMTLEDLSSKVKKIDAMEQDIAAMKQNSDL